MTSPAIEVRDLRKTYPAFRRKGIAALRGVSLRVDPGTIFGLIGQNGAGKTTLVKILLGLATPTGGSATILGRSPKDSSARRRVGYLPEQMRLPDYLNAKDFLRYMGKLNGVDPGAMKQNIPALLETVGLGGVRGPVKAYSKGMQQRLGLAQALINDPDILFLDEPTDGLDPLGRKEVRDLLVRLRGKGKTIFLNSHLLSEIEFVCDKIAILNKGEVACSSAPSEFTRGTGEYVVRVAAVNDLVRTAAEAALQTNAIAWYENCFRFPFRDLAQLNDLLDRLRRVPVEIEAVEPVKRSLEEFFLEVVGTPES
ncbi:MAG: ABC transporter ATP-binding protein [Candidatus Acidiferrales bacterium]